MRQTIDWLIEVEGRACDVYARAAILFSEDPEFSDFVMELSAEEKQHHDILRRAAELLERKGAGDPFAFAGDDLRENLMERFLSLEKEIEGNTLTRARLVEFIVLIEYSEWNDFFKYVVASLKRRFRELVPFAVEIEKHRKRIERFLEGRPEFRSSLETIRSLPCLWKERILVVDDEQTITELFAACLAGEGSIDCAANGVEALEKVETNYYAAIISDVDMPVMDGIEFYRKASEKYPGINGRFLFISGEPGPERLEFFKANHLRYFVKPSSLKDLKKAVIDILSA